MKAADSMKEFYRHIRFTVTLSLAILAAGYFATQSVQHLADHTYEVNYPNHIHDTGPRP